MTGADGIRHWDRGERILWRYRDNGSGHVHICRPVTVVQDTDELLAVWMAPGTECVKPVLADGTPVHHEPSPPGTPRRGARLVPTGRARVC